MPTTSNKCLECIEVQYDPTHFCPSWATCCEENLNRQPVGPVHCSVPSVPSVSNKYQMVEPRPVITSGPRKSQMLSEMGEDPFPTKTQMLQWNHGLLVPIGLDEYTQLQPNFIPAEKFTGERSGYVFEPEVPHGICQVEPDIGSIAVTEK